MEQWRNTAENDYEHHSEFSAKEKPDPEEYAYNMRGAVSGMNVGGFG